MENKRNRKSIRFLFTAAGLILILALSACGSKNKDSDTADKTSEESTESSVDDNGENTESNSVAPPPESGEDLVIQTKDISATTKFYPVTVGGTKMEVMAVTAPDGTIRTAFNTCQVCNGSPYAYFVQKGDAVECQNCKNVFPMDRVGIEAGGCNPVPIFDEDKTVTNETITVSYDVLRENAPRFPANWKSK